MRYHINRLIGYQKFLKSYEFWTTKVNPPNFDRFEIVEYLKSW